MSLTAAVLVSLAAWLLLAVAVAVLWALMFAPQPRHRATPTRTRPGRPAKTQQHLPQQRTHP